MQAMVDVRKQKRVVVARELPMEALEHTQVLIVDGERWHALAPFPWRVHGEWGLEEVLGVVRCPVVDVSAIDPANDIRAGDVIRSCSDARCGVFNLSGLLTGLEALGGVVDRTREI